MGGANELLAEEFLVEVDEVDKLAEKMIALLIDPPLLEAQSAKNRAIADQYHVAKVQPVRESFYQAVMQVNV